MGSRRAVALVLIGVLVMMAAFGGGRFKGAKLDSGTKKGGDTAVFG
jgi:hypothetical protein